MTNDIKKFTIIHYSEIKEKNQNQEICLAAVKTDGRALQYVEEQTPEICLAAA